MNILKLRNKDIFLTKTEKETLEAALSNVINNIFGVDNEMSEIYKDTLRKIMPNTANSGYKVNLFGCQDDACIFALQETDTEIAHNLVEKIRKAPNVSTKYD